METLKKVVTNQYFPAAAVLTAVVLFWTIAMFGGLSLLNKNQPPMATLTWMLFVYGAAVLTPLAGIIAASDLIRRWRRNRQYAKVGPAEYDVAEDEAAHEPAAKAAALTRPVQQGTDTHHPAKKQQNQPKQRKTAA